MSAGEPRNAKHKPARKKLRLSKETMKDLVHAKGTAGDVKGGAARCSRQTVGYGC